MATRSRKVVETKGAPSARVGTPATGTTSTATTSRTRTGNAAPTATTRATRSAKTTTATSATVKEEKNAPAAKRAVVKKGATASAKPKVDTAEDIDREPIQAFLRIRPNHQKEAHSPYLVALSDTTVQMTDPSSNIIHAHTLSLPTPPTVYTFTHVFTPSTTQDLFFTRSALPLVNHLLKGQNGLLFAYGVTNSGKTYSIQGGKTAREAGILPRTLDVVFQAIEGSACSRRLRPLGLSGVEILGGEGADEPDEGLTDGEKKVAAMIDQILADEDGAGDADTEMQSVDNQHDDGNAKEAISADKDSEYAVWVSYAEVYNEKIFDLLSVDDSSQTTGTSKLGAAPGPMSSYMNLAALAASGSSASISSSLAGNAGSTLSTSSSFSGPLTLRRRALGLKTSPDGKGKYIYGLREVRVKSAEEAKNVLKMGVVNRRVFGTVANKASSRSHAIFTVKVAKVQKGSRRGSPSDEDVVISRLSIVDLAGSERARNAGTMRGEGEGERLREAGNINKSLMVLGQCLEALRMNQKKLVTATSLGTKDGDIHHPKLAIVPFRHSKITEIFQDFFVGEGRAVMIININPYDTGFDENSHVMRFAAIAREVSTSTTATGLALNTSKGPSFLPPSNSASRAPSRLKNARLGMSQLGISPTKAVQRKVVLSFGSSIASGRRDFAAGSRPSVNTVVDVIEESEDIDEDQDGDDEDGAYPLVDELFSRIEELEVKLYEAEMRAAMVETETREEVAMEMQERLELMDKMYRERLNKEAEENDRKTDEKMDLLSRALRTGGGTSPMKRGTVEHEAKLREEAQKKFIPDMTMISDVTIDEEDEVLQSLKHSDDEDDDDINGSPSARYGSQPLNRAPAKKAGSPIKSNSPSKAVRAPIEVSDNDSEPEPPVKSNLTRNPIMDMQEEEEAAMTDPDMNTEDSTEEEEEESFAVTQAEEVEGGEETPPASSEGEGDTIGSDEASEEIEALGESFDDEEDEDSRTKYVFEHLAKSSPPKSGKIKAKIAPESSSTKAKTSSKITGKAKRVIESSEEEAEDVDKVQSDEEEDEIDMLSPSKAAAATKAGGAGGKTSKARASGKTGEIKKTAVPDEEMDDLTNRIGKTAIKGDSGGGTRAVRKSTRTKG